jgi:hypothetical protein
LRDGCAWHLLRSKSRNSDLNYPVPRLRAGGFISHHTKKEKTKNTEKNTMKKILLTTIGLAAVSLAGITSVQAQVVINNTNFVNGVYIQNFDSFAGTALTMPTGWSVESSNALNYVGNGTGSGTTGGIYSFGAASASDRALGVLESGSFGDARILVTVQNGLGAALQVRGMTTDYVMEQWRDSARHNRFRFRQSPNNTNFSEDIAFDRAPEQAPTQSGSGNTAAFRNVRQNLAFTIQREDPLNAGQLIDGSLGNGDSQILRWQFGSVGSATGARDGLAIDDFRLTVTNVLSTVSGTSYTTTVHAPVNAATLYSVNELYGDTSSPAPAQQDTNYSYAGYGMGSEFAGGTDTEALIIAGVASADKPITMSLALTPSAFADNDSARISDVFSLTGTGSDLIVLQLTVSSGITDSSSLGWLDNGSWVNAVDGNTGNNAILAQQGYLGSFSAFQGLYGTDLTQYVGGWGVDTSSQSVWAVINHNSEFAAIPEPGTWVLITIGLSVVLLRRKMGALKA